MAFSLMLPFLFASRPRHWWNGWNYPRHIQDQKFGVGLSESDLTISSCQESCRSAECIKASGLSEVINSSDKFQIKLDVKEFEHGELTLKTEDNFVVIKGKHKEITDKFGFVSREFTRRYILPEGVEPENVTAYRTTGGILVIEAPKSLIDSSLQDERDIPVVVDKCNTEVTNDSS